ncbi:MAG: hypothetical protein ACI4LC_01850 [Emergencia sp.]
MSSFKQNNKWTVLVIILISMSLFLWGCKSEESQNLEVDLDLAEKEYSTCCYANEKEIVFSIGERTGALIGPLVNTTKLIVYDIEMKKIVQNYDLCIEEYVYYAVPYENGIVYSLYQAREDDETYQWYIKYVSKKGEKLLDQGTCSTYDRMPMLGILDGVPVYLYENIADGSYGVKKIENFQVDLLEEFYEGSLLSTEIHIADDQYCFMVEDDNQLNCCFGNLTGILDEVEFEGQLISYGLNKEHIFISVATEEDTYCLYCIDTKNASIETFFMDQPLYRLTGSGQSMLCVDYQFNVYSVTIGQDVTLTEKFIKENDASGNASVFFFSVGEDNYIIAFMLDGITYDYYIVEL